MVSSHTQRGSLNLYLSAEGLGSLSFPSTICKLKLGGERHREGAQLPVQEQVGEHAAIHEPARSPNPREPF